jgi:hypothetical protein
MKGRIEREEGMCSVLASTGTHDVQAGGGGLHCVTKRETEREIERSMRRAGRQAGSSQQRPEVHSKLWNIYPIEPAYTLPSSPKKLV